MEMPFGKHIGEEISELPSGYLRWMVENMDPINNEDLIDEAQHELEYRDVFGGHWD